MSSLVWSEEHLAKCDICRRIKASFDSDPRCDSCGRRGREMVTATFADSTTFSLCSTCGQDAAEHGCEVTS